MCLHCFGKIEVTDWAVNAVLAYILMNHWISIITTDSYCLKNRQTCSKSQLPHHLYIICSKCLPPGSSTNRCSYRSLAPCTSPTARSVNSVIQICLHVLGASFQFVDIRDPYGRRSSTNIGGASYFHAEGVWTQFGRGAAGDIWWQQI